jgi:hypothetical protein
MSGQLPAICYASNESILIDKSMFLSTQYSISLLAVSVARLPAECSDTFPAKSNIQLLQSLLDEQLWYYIIGSCTQ